MRPLSRPYLTPGFRPAVTGEEMAERERRGSPEFKLSRIVSQLGRVPGSLTGDRPDPPPGRDNLPLPSQKRACLQGKRWSHAVH